MFCDPLLFWGKIINSIKVINTDYLNQFLNVFNIEPFDLLIPEDLEVVSSIELLPKSSIELKDLIQKFTTQLDSYENRIKCIKKKTYLEDFARFPLENILNTLRRSLNDINEKLNLISSQLMIIISKAGQGKTCFLCDFANSVLVKRNIESLFILAKDLPDGSCENLLNNILFKLTGKNNYSNSNIILNILEEHYRAKNKCLIVIIDGLNEHKNLPAFTENIEGLFEKLLSSPYIKIIISCREEYYSQRFSNLDTSSFRNNIVKCSNIHHEMSDNEKNALLNGYLKHFNLELNFLSVNVRSQLSNDPLLLRFFCEAYGDTKSKDIIKLPPVYNLCKDRLFDKYFEEKREIILSNIHTSQLLHKRKLSDLMQDIIIYMIGNSVYENIPLDIIDIDKTVILEDLMNEDIILMHDLLPANSALSSNEVFNFVFDEVRDYFIAKYIAKNYTNDIEKYSTIITNITRNEVTTSEGVSRFLFHIAKKQPNNQLNNMMMNQEWYENVYIKEILSVEEQYISDNDVEKVKGILINGETDDQEHLFVTILFIRYNNQFFPKINLDIIFNIFNEMNEDNLLDYIDVLFNNGLPHNEIPLIVRFTSALDSLIGDETKKISNYKILFKFLIYLFGVRGYNHEEYAMDVFKLFLKKYQQFAIEILSEMIDVKSRRLHYYILRILLDAKLTPNDQILTIFNSTLRRLKEIQNLDSSNYDFEVIYKNTLVHLLEMYYTNFQICESDKSMIESEVKRINSQSFRTYL